VHTPWLQGSLVENLCCVLSLGHRPWQCACLEEGGRLQGPGTQPRGQLLWAAYMQGLYCVQLMQCCGRLVHGRDVVNVNDRDRGICRYGAVWWHPWSSDLAVAMLEAITA